MRAGDAHAQRNVARRSGHQRDTKSRLVDGVTLLPKPYARGKVAEKVREALDKLQ